MTRRETRKTRSGRRARIGTECLESRNLLSGPGAIAPAQFVPVPPSGSYLTSLRGATGPVAQMKITGPNVNYQTSLWGGSESLDYTKVGKVVHQTSKWSATEPVARMKITGPDVNHQTSLWGAPESFAHLKYSKQD
jgi:hypothetical protein